MIRNSIRTRLPIFAVWVISNEKFSLPTFAAIFTTDFAHLVQLNGVQNYFRSKWCLKDQLRLQSSDFAHPCKKVILASIFVIICLTESVKFTNAMCCAHIFEQSGCLKWAFGGSIKTPAMQCLVQILHGLLKIVQSYFWAGAWRDNWRLNWDPCNALSDFAQPSRKVFLAKVFVIICLLQLVLRSYFWAKRPLEVGFWPLQVQCFVRLCCIGTLWHFHSKLFLLYQQVTSSMCWLIWPSNWYSRNCISIRWVNRYRTSTCFGDCVNNLYYSHLAVYRPIYYISSSDFCR